MSLYNMINKVNIATFFILPMLGKHPDEYPRFRDCFVFEPEFKLHDGWPVIVQKVDSKKDVICVLTRVGGGNRESYQKQIAEVKLIPGYLYDYDDHFDSTFCTFVFSIPEEWKSDYEKITAKKTKLKKLSPAYQKRMAEVYPKLKKQFRELFK